MAVWIMGVKQYHSESPTGSVVSMLGRRHQQANWTPPAVLSGGEYGVPEGLQFGFPGRAIGPGARYGLPRTGCLLATVSFSLEEVEPTYVTLPP